MSNILSFVALSSLHIRFSAMSMTYFISISLFSCLYLYFLSLILFAFFIAICVSIIVKIIVILYYLCICCMEYQNSYQIYLSIRLEKRQSCQKFGKHIIAKVNFDLFMNISPNDTSLQYYTITVNFQLFYTCISQYLMKKSYE